MFFLVGNQKVLFASTVQEVQMVNHGNFSIVCIWNASNSMRGSRFFSSPRLLLYSTIMWSLNTRRELLFMATKKDYWNPSWLFIWVDINAGNSSTDEKIVLIPLHLFVYLLNWWVGKLSYIFQCDKGVRITGITFTMTDIPIFFLWNDLLIVGRICDTKLSYALLSSSSYYKWPMNNVVRDNLSLYHIAP